MTVNGNKAHFTKRQLDRTEKAQSLYTSLGFPSESDFRWILQSNQIKDCPVTIDDADNAMKIWGRNLSMLKRKLTRKTPSAVELDPTEIRKLHRSVSLSVEIFFGNRIPFLSALSRNIRFTTATHLADCRTTTIFKALRRIVLYYFQCGFQDTVVTADSKFASWQEHMVALPAPMNMSRILSGVFKWSRKECAVSVILFHSAPIPNRLRSI